MRLPGWPVKRRACHCIGSYPACRPSAGHGTYRVSCRAARAADASLPRPAVEPLALEPGAPPPLLSEDFLANVLANYAPPAPSPPRAFAVKQLNVADPLVRAREPTLSQGRERRACRAPCRPSSACCRSAFPLCGALRSADPQTPQRACAGKLSLRVALPHGRVRKACASARRTGRVRQRRRPRTTWGAA